MARGMLMGALSGLGQGMIDNANRWTMEDIKAAEQQAEVEKQRRAFEQAKALKALDNDYDIAREKRGIENDKIRAQNEINLKSDPANIEKMANAEIGLLSRKDAYQDSRFDIDLDQAGRLAKAKHIDNTDYEYQKLQRQILQNQLDEAKRSGKLTDSEKETIKIYRDKAEKLDSRIQDYKVRLADDTLNEGERQALNTQLEVAIAAQNQAISSALSIANKGGASGNMPSRDVIDGDTKETESEAEKRFAAFNRFKQSGAYKAYLEGGGKNISNIADLTTEEMNALSDEVLGKDTPNNEDRELGNKVQKQDKNQYSSLLEQRKAFKLADQIMSMTDTFELEDLQTKPVSALQAILKELNEAESDRKKTKRASYVGHKGERSPYDDFFFN